MNLSAVAGKASHSPRKWRRQKSCEGVVWGGKLFKLANELLTVVPWSHVVFVTLFSFLRISFRPHVCSVLLSRSHVVHSSSSFSETLSHNKVFFPPDFCQSIQLCVRSPVKLHSLWLFCYFYTKRHVVFTCHNAWCHHDGHVLTCCQFYRSFLHCSYHHHHHHHYLFVFPVTIVVALTIITLMSITGIIVLWWCGSFSNTAPTTWRGQMSEMIKWQIKRNRREKIINCPSSSTIYTWPYFLPALRWTHHKEPQSAFGETRRFCLLSPNVSSATCSCIPLIDYWHIYTHRYVFSHLIWVRRLKYAVISVTVYLFIWFMAFWNIKWWQQKKHFHKRKLVFIIYVSLPSINIAV